MIRVFREDDLAGIMQIWIDANLKAHDFIPKEYWTSHYSMVKEILLQSEIYVYENSAARRIDGFIGLTGNYAAGIFVGEAAQSNSGEISKLLHKSLMPKLDEIMAALDGIVTPLQRALLEQILDHIDDLDKRIQELDRMAEAYMAEFQPAIAEVCQMPGIARRSAEVILAETGIDMSRFPSAAHLCSWTGVCPGNH